MITTPSVKVNSAPVDKGIGTQSEVMPTRTTAGNNANETTAMNSAALGGINTNLIGSHVAEVKSSLKNIEASKSLAKITQHIATIHSHLNAIQSHVNDVSGKNATKTPSRPAYSRVVPKGKPDSEADDDDMSNYDPDLGLGGKGYEAARK